MVELTSLIMVLLAFCQGPLGGAVEPSTGQSHCRRKPMFVRSGQTQDYHSSPLLTFRIRWIVFVLIWACLLNILNIIMEIIQFLKVLISLVLLLMLLLKIQATRSITAATVPWAVHQQSSRVLLSLFWQILRVREPLLLRDFTRRRFCLKLPLE